MGDKMSKTKRLFYFSTLAIFILSFFSHYLYKWSSYSSFIGAFSTINESIFQHLKMFIYPTIFYYLVTFIIFYKRYDIDAKRYFIAIAITIIVTSFIVSGSYYLFKFGFNIENMFIDISSLIIGLFISSIISNKIYYSFKIIRYSGYASLLFAILLIVTITYFQVNPIKVDFFYDNQNKTYYEVKS